MSMHTLVPALVLVLATKVDLAKEQIDEQDEMGLMCAENVDVPP